MTYIIIFSYVLTLFTFSQACDQKKNHGSNSGKNSEFKYPQRETLKIVASDKCDVEKLVIPSKRIKTLNQNEIEQVLSRIGPTCENNVEFSEYLNELVFDLIKNRTDITLKVIQTSKKINNAYLFDILSNPLNDGIDVIGIKKKVIKINFDPKLKKRILQSLDTAIINFQGKSRN